MAAAVTFGFIACLGKEHNAGREAIAGRAWQTARIPGKILALLKRRRVAPGGNSRMVEFSNRVQVPPCVLVRRLDGELVLLNLQTERYFGLDAMGSRMWEAATGSPTIAAAYEKLLEEFEVDADVLRNHLDELLSGLVENGLLALAPADVGTIPAI